MIFHTITVVCLIWFGQSEGTCITEQGTVCVFPFTTRGVTYHSCTYAGGFSKPWCSTKVDSQGVTVIGNYGDCPRNAQCPNDRDPPITTTTKKPTTTAPPTGCQNKEGKGADYVGSVSKTKSGLTCQKWSSQSPHRHGVGSLGDHNFCRNPDGTSGVWCYTTNPSKRWELCDVPLCEAANTRQCCGRKYPVPKIVGGNDASLNEYPWLVHLLVTYPGDGSYNCGGSLVASQWILTAEHCTTPKNGQLPTVKVTLGDHVRSKTGESSIEREMSVSKVINYGGGLSTDISMLKLSQPVDLRTYMPICLPQPTAQYTGKKAWVYGWGTTSYGGSTADTVQEAQIDVVSNSACDAAFSNNGINMDPIKSSQVCAGANGKDSCQGDSGGPLSYDNNGIHEQIGIVSYGIGCASPGLYGVYSSVAHFSNWIHKTMEDNGGYSLC